MAVENKALKPHTTRDIAWGLTKTGIGAAVLTTVAAGLQWSHNADIPVMTGMTDWSYGGLGNLGAEIAHYVPGASFLPHLVATQTPVGQYVNESLLTTIGAYESLMAGARVIGAVRSNTPTRLAERAEEKARRKSLEGTGGSTAGAIGTLFVEMIPGQFGPWGVGDVITLFEGWRGRTLDGHYLTRGDKWIYYGASVLPFVPARPIVEIHRAARGHGKATYKTKK